MNHDTSLFLTNGPTCLHTHPKNLFIKLILPCHRSRPVDHRECCDSLLRSINSERLSQGSPAAKCDPYAKKSAPRSASPGQASDGNSDVSRRAILVDFHFSVFPNSMTSKQKLMILPASVLSSPSFLPEIEGWMAATINS
jgi:hypothetical protein